MMADYRHVTITFPGGRVVNTILEEGDASPELTNLRLLYGARVRIGERLSPDEAHYIEKVQKQTYSATRKPRKCQPELPGNQP